jgi:hypothetical protein
MSDKMTEAVTRNFEANRYEIQVDGNLAGVVEYNEHDGRIDMTHTEVVQEHRGTGTAGALAGGAIVDAVNRELIIVPTCPYIENYLRRHTIAGAKVEWPRED